MFISVFVFTKGDINASFIIKKGKVDQTKPFKNVQPKDQENKNKIET